MSLSFFKFLFLTLLFLSPLQAKSIDFDVEILVTQGDLDFHSVKKSPSFVKHLPRDLNLGFVRDKEVWLKIHIQNNTNNPIKKILEIQNPLLEEVLFYDEKKLLAKDGMLHKKDSHRTIEPYFEISMQADSAQIYYVHIKNKTTAMRFLVSLQDPYSFFDADTKQQLLIILLLGVIIALFLYNFLLYVYTKEIAYLYYCLYLVTLIAHQFTYLGMTPLFVPQSIVNIDNLSVVLKVNGMYILASFFAKEFLATKQYPKIDSLYNLIESSEQTQ